MLQATAIHPTTVCRARARQSLLKATEAELAKLQGSVNRGRLSGAARIGLRVGEVINRHRVKRHFRIEITDNSFDFARREDAIAAEAALDGIQVIRPSLPGPVRLPRFRAPCRADSPGSVMRRQFWAYVIFSHDHVQGTELRPDSPEDAGFPQNTAMLETRS